jgi:hypothetical protein
MTAVESASEARPPRRAHKLSEWKECRTQIARIDKAIADLRKYGFILLAGLLTAKAYLIVDVDGTAPQLGSRFAVSLVMMLLIYALFVVDRYHEVLLKATLKRSYALENELGMSLTHSVSILATESHVDRWGVQLYVLFILVNFVAVALAHLVFLTKYGYTSYAFWPQGTFLLLSCALAAATWYAVYEYDCRTRKFCGCDFAT